MLVVLAIIGLIVGLVGPRVVNYLSESKVKAAQIQMENLASALDLYYLDNGRYPTSAEGLAALVQKPSESRNWNGPYLKAATALKDPWGKPYLYRFPGTTGAFDLGSSGPEGRDTERATITRAGDAPR
jgi:general secretion pathway protein G